MPKIIVIGHLLLKLL